MSRSGLGKPGPDLEGVELLFHLKGGSGSFVAKVALSLKKVDPVCMNSITESTCTAKCLNNTFFIYFLRFIIKDLLTQRDLVSK